MRLAMLNSDDKRHAALEPPENLELELVPIRVAGFARNPYDHLFVELGHVDAAERAEATGCDGIFIDTFADYGIERIRHTVAIPVFGAGEAGIAAAAGGGRRFSIVTVWPESLRFLYEERLAACPGGDSCAGVHYFSPEKELELVGTDAGVAARMIAHDGSLVEQLAHACRRAVEADGSEAVLCGCTCMAPIGPLLAARCEFPVIESSRAGQAAAMEALMRGAPAANRELSARRGSVRALVDVWLGEADGRQPQLDDDGCEVCVTLSGDEQDAGDLARR